MADTNNKEAATQKRQDTYRQVAVWLPALTVILFLGYAAAAWFLLFVPKLAQLVPGGDLDNTAIRERIDTDQAYIDRIDKALTSYHQISEEQIKKVSQVLPTDIAFPSLLGQLEGIALANNMLLTGLETTTGLESAGIGEAVAVQVNASFAGGSGLTSFKRLLRSLEKSQRLVDVTSFQYAPGVTGYSVTMMTYYLPPR